MSSAHASVIRFYEAHERPYGAFCNYYISAITIGGKRYPSVEHYYQSQKFHGVDEQYAEVVRKASTPNQSKILARLQTGGGYAWRVALNPIIQKFKDKGTRQRADWDTVKDDVMRQGLLAKFGQHRDLAQLLLRTGNAQIIENSPRDWYWGCGADGKGKNALGRLLMKVREELRSAPPPAAAAAAAATAATASATIATAAGNVAISLSSASSKPTAIPFASALLSRIRGDTDLLTDEEWPDESQLATLIQRTRDATTASASEDSKRKRDDAEDAGLSTADSERNVKCKHM